MTASEQYDYSLSLNEGTKIADNLIKSGFSFKTDAFLRQLCQMNAANDDLTQRELVLKKIIDAVVLMRKPLSDDHKLKLFNHIQVALKQMNAAKIGIDDQILATLLIDSAPTPSIAQHNANILQLARQLEENTAFFELTAAKYVQIDNAREAELTERCLAFIREQDRPKGVVYALALVNLKEVGTAMNILSALSEKGCATDMASFIHRLLPFVEGDDLEGLMALLQQNLLKQQELSDCSALYDYTTRVYLQAARSFLDNDYYKQSEEIIALLENNQRLNGFEADVQGLLDSIDKIKQKYLEEERAKMLAEAAKAQVIEAEVVPAAEPETETASEDEPETEAETEPVSEVPSETEPASEAETKSAPVSMLTEGAMSDAESMFKSDPLLEPKENVDEEGEPGLSVEDVLAPLDSANIEPADGVAVDDAAKEEAMPAIEDVLAPLDMVIEEPADVISESNKAMDMPPTESEASAEPLVTEEPAAVAEPEPIVPPKVAIQRGLPSAPKKNASFTDKLKSKFFKGKVESVSDKISNIKDKININNNLGINSENLDKGLNIIKDVASSAIKLAGEQTEKVKQKVENIVKSDENQETTPVKPKVPEKPKKVLSSFYDVPFWERENAEELEQREQALMNSMPVYDETAEEASENVQDVVTESSDAGEVTGMPNLTDGEPVVPNRIEERINERQEGVEEASLSEEPIEGAVEEPSASETMSAESASEEPEKKPGFEDVDLSKVSNFSSLDDFAYQSDEEKDTAK